MRFVRYLASWVKQEVYESMKSFKEFLREKESISGETNKKNYADESDKDLFKEFNTECVGEGLKNKLGTSLGSILAFRSHLKLKGEKDLHKKINLLSDVLIAVLAAIMSKKG